MRSIHLFASLSCSIKVVFAIAVALIISFPGVLILGMSVPERKTQDVLSLVVQGKGVPPPHETISVPVGGVSHAPSLSPVNHKRLFRRLQSIYTN